MLARLAATMAVVFALVLLVLTIAWPDPQSVSSPRAGAPDGLTAARACAGALPFKADDPGALGGGTARHDAPRPLVLTRQGRRAAGLAAGLSRQTATGPAAGRFVDHDTRTAPLGEPVTLPGPAAALLAQRAAGRQGWPKGAEKSDRLPAPARPDTLGGPLAEANRAAPWSADQLLANPTQMNDEYVALKASPLTGNLFAVFSAYDLGGSTRDIYIARSLDQGASWTTLKMPTFSLDESMPDLAIDAAGYLYVVWVRSDGVLIRARSAGPEDIANWAYVQGFVVGEPVAVPSLAVSGSGDFARVFIACSWYTVNWSWYQYEYTLLWLTSTNGGQTVAYDYFEPDGYQDLWPVVAMHGATVYMVNGEQDPYSGRIRILAAADALSGSFGDYIDLTQGSPMSNGYPSLAAEGQNVHIVYQLDWDGGVGGIDGDVMYVFSWDGLATAYGPYAMMATTSESVGPQVATRGDVVTCVWLEAPAGGDEFHLAARQAPLAGHPDYWGETEQATDLPMVVPQFRSAAAAVGGAMTGGTAAGPLVAIWMDRRDFAAQGFNIYTSRRQLLPDLKPFTPSGWESPLVVSMVPGQRVDGPVAAGYPVYASLAVANLGLTAAPGPVAVELRRDGQLIGAWSVPGGLSAGSYATAEDHAFTLTAGLHTLRLLLDPQDLIVESDETDNDLAKDIWVLSCDPCLELAPASLVLGAEAPADRPLALRQAVSGKETLDARLQAALRQAGEQDRLRVIVTPRDQPDLADLASRGRRKASLALKEKAASFAAEAAAHGAAQTATCGTTGPHGKNAPALRPLWLSGELAGELSPVEIAHLAALPQVDRIWLDDLRNETFAGRTAAGAVPPAMTAPASAPWHLQMLGAPSVWAQGLDGSGILVGHTDSGVAWDHPDLAGRLWNGLPGFPHHGYDFLDDDDDPYDDGSGGFWHGTHTAGLIVSASSGVAPGARVLVARCVPGYYQDLVEALQFCLDQGCHLISTSAGWTQAGDALRSANRNNAEIMLAIGVPWFTAAGNGDNQGGHLAIPFDMSSPGDCPEPAYGSGGHSAVIAVGAITQDHQLWSSSSLGPTAWNVAGNPAHADYPYPPGLVKPDLVAPGVAVTSTIGGGAFAAYSGTSMATPLVAGAAAILLQANPTLAPAELAAVLAATAADLGPGGRDNQYGAGLVDLPAAVAELPAATATVVWARNLGAVPLLIESITTAAAWLQPVPASGAVAPGDSLRVIVSWDASGLTPGAYYADIVFVSNDPRHTVLLPVTLIVGQATAVQDPPPPPERELRIYPNPFNPQTTVRFELAAAGPVALRIYDARGRLVRDLLIAERPAGLHESAWDGRDAAGRMCAAGIYLARLQSGNEVRTGRMLLVR